MIRPASIQTAIAVMLLTASSVLAQGPGYGPPAMTGGFAPPGVSYGQNVVNYRVNQHGRHGSDTQPIEAFLRQAGQRSWLRLEYLHWNIEDPGNRTVGAPILDSDGREPVEVTDRNEVEPFGFSVVPNFDGASLNDTSGIRGTYGIWFDGGSIEFSVFGSEQASADDRINIQADRLAEFERAGTDLTTVDLSLGTDQSPNVIIPLLTNGSPTNLEDLRFIGLDSSYTSSLRSQFWGAELNVLSAPQASVNPVTWQWLGGIRYLSFDERLSQTGVFDNGGTLEVPLEYNFRSSTINNSYGPTIGFRSQFDSRYLTLSVTPRITFALNDYTSESRTFGTGFADPDDPDGSTLTRFSEEEIDFTTITQVTFMAELHPTEAFTLFAGYDFLWNSRVVRTFNQSTFDSAVSVDTGAFFPAVTSRPNPESLAIEGLSFGATLRF